MGRHWVYRFFITVHSSNGTILFLNLRVWGCCWPLVRKDADAENDFSYCFTAIYLFMCLGDIEGVAIEINWVDVLAPSGFARLLTQTWYFIRRLFKWFSPLWLPTIWVHTLLFVHSENQPHVRTEAIRNHHLSFGLKVPLDYAFIKL